MNQELQAFYDSLKPLPKQSATIRVYNKGGFGKNIPMNKLKEWRLAGWKTERDIDRLDKKTQRLTILKHFS